MSTASSSRPRHATSLRTHRVARGVAIGLTAVLAFGAGTVAFGYLKLQGNIDSGNADALLTARPSKSPVDGDAGEPLNFLLLGSDARDGENEEIGGYFAGERSDTAILAHISADRKRVELVSIPRDTMIDIPSCTMSDGSTSSPRFSQFNEAFSIGADQGKDVVSAAACAIATVESFSDVFIDGYFVVDFAGFVDMVEAIDGVEMCIPHYMYSKKAKLELQPGVQRLDGKQSIAFVRARKGTGLGDGSDLGRAGRQQQFLAAMVSEVLSKNVLSDSVGLYRFLDAVTSSLAADEKYAGLDKLAGLAYSARNVKAKNITFMTIPVETYRPKPAQVQLAAAAEDVWAAIRADEPIGGKKDDGASSAPSKSPSASASKKPTPDPSPTKTKQAGREQFSADDVTAVCG